VFDHPPITTLAVPFYLLTIVGELFWLRRRRADPRYAGYERRDTWVSLTLGLGSLITGLVIIAGDVVIARFIWDRRVLPDWGESGWVWIAAIVLVDLSYYWSHRAGHRIRFFWANHVQHHSSEQYNLSTALRQPVTNFYEWLFFPTLALLGIRPWILFGAFGLNLVYQYWIHTEVIQTLPRWFEWLFNTPSHHRVHHGSNQQYLDKNYGGILIVFDRLFGTFEPEVEPVRYGLTKNINTFNPFRVISHEYVAMARGVRSGRGLAAKLGAVFAPPGWRSASPDATPVQAVSSAP